MVIRVLLYLHLDYIVTVEDAKETVKFHVTLYQRDKEKRAELFKLLIKNNSARDEIVNITMDNRRERHGVERIILNLFVKIEIHLLHEEIIGVTFRS